MTRPYAVLRAGYPYVKTIGARSRTIMPADVAIADDGTIYALCQGSHYGKGKSGPIYITNINDENLGSFAWRNLELPVKHCEYLWPCQIVLDSRGILYASDQAVSFLQMYTRDGHYLGRKGGEEGSEPGEFNRPSGLAVDAEDNLYVVDSLNHRIQKFDKDGRFISMFGEFGSEPGQFNMPWGIHVDSEHDEIYVADWRNDRVQVFDTNWEFQFQFGESGSGKGQFRRPTGVAVDKDGDIYVCDWGNKRVQLFDRKGKYLMQFLGDATISKLQLEQMLNRLSAKQRRIREEADLEQEKFFEGIKSVRVGKDGLMYVPDFEHYRIQIYKKESYPLTEQQILPPLKVPTLNPN